MMDSKTIYDLVLDRIDKRIALMRKANGRLKKRLLEDKLLSTGINRLSRSRKKIEEAANAKKDISN